MISATGLHAQARKATRIKTEGAQALSIPNTTDGRDLLTYLRWCLNRGPQGYTLRVRGRATERRAKGGTKSDIAASKGDWMAVYLEPRHRAARPCQPEPNTRIEPEPTQALDLATLVRIRKLTEALALVENRAAGLRASLDEIEDILLAARTPAPAPRFCEGSVDFLRGHRGGGL